MAAALVVVACTLFLTALVSAWQLVNKPLAWAGGESASGEIWHRDRSLRVLLVTVESLSESPAVITDLGFLSLNPLVDKATLVHLPLDEVFADGQEGLVGEDVGLLIRYVTQTTYYHYDRYVIIDEPGLLRIRDAYKNEAWEKAFSLVKAPALFSVLSQAHSLVRTDLSLFEAAQALRYLYSLRSDGFSEFEWSELVWRAGQSLYDTLFFEDRIRISVLNGTSVPGLAGRMARVVENLGGQIMEVGNADRSDYQQTILVGNDLSSYSSNFLQYIFQIDQTRPAISMLEKRADLTIIVGLDNALY